MYVYDLRQTPTPDQKFFGFLGTVENPTTVERLPMTMVKALFLRTSEAVEQSFILSNSVFKDVFKYCNGKSASRARNKKLHEDLAQLEKINLEVHSQLKVAVREVSRLNKELKSVTEAQNHGAGTAYTPSTPRGANVAPKPDGCVSATPNKPASLPKRDVLWDSDDSETELDINPDRKPYSKYTRKRPLEELHHFFIKENGWLKRVVPSELPKTSENSVFCAKSEEKLHPAIKKEDDMNKENYRI